MTTLKLKNTNFIIKKALSKNDIDINEIVACNKILSGKHDSKYFIGYNDNVKLRALSIFSPEMSIYKR